MQIHFLKEEMEKNIEFTKQIYDMKDLVGYNATFDKFLPNKWQRVHNPKIQLKGLLTS